MHRLRILGHGLSRSNLAPRQGRPLIRLRGAARGIVTDADVERARVYCQKQIRHSDYDAHLINRFLPPRVHDIHLALRTLNLELVRLPDLVSNPTIGQLRMQFWRESIDKTITGSPPAEPICVLLHHAVEKLREREGVGRSGPGPGPSSGSANASASAVKFWIQRLIKTRGKHMDNRPFPSLAALEDYGENTYASLMYAVLASMPMKSAHVDHLASHIGKAAGIVAVLRGVPVLAAPQQQQQQAVKSPDSGGEGARPREPVLLLPLDVMAEAGVREEDLFRKGPAGAEGFQDAVFQVATRANDHLITAREMLRRLRAGEGPGHEFEHSGEEGHVYDHDADAGAGGDVTRDIKRSFGVLLEAVPTQEYLSMLEAADFDPFRVKASWKLPWRIWQALRKQQI